MKKRLIAFGMMIVLIMAMSMTAMAAGTVTSDEQAVLNHFWEVQKVYVDKGLISDKVANDNYAAGRQVFLDNDYSADACKDANKLIDAWAAELAKTPNSTKKDLSAKRANLISITNNFKSDYFTISAVDINVSKKGACTISVTPKPAGGNSGSDVPAQENATTTTITIGQGIINQTGVDTTATVAVLGGVALISLLGVGAFVVSRSKKVAR